jgi:cell division transport system permease protein
MKVWLAQHARALTGTLSQLARAPATNLLNIGVIGIALALPVAFYVGLVNLQQLAGRVAVEPQLTLFLALDAGAEDLKRIEARLKAHAGVRTFSFVSREQALKELRAGSGMGDVIDGLGRNPLPDAFVVDAADGAPERLEALRDEFRRWPKVEHVQLDSAWARRLDAVLALGRMAALMLGGLLAFALTAVTFNTIRLQILTRQEEIEVARLIGATDSFIRRPFLYYGAVLGLAGGAAAWGIVWAGVRLLNSGVVELARLYGADFELRQLAPADSASLLAFAGWLGWCGAWLSVSRHLSRLAPR